MNIDAQNPNNKIITGAEQSALYLPLLKNKRVGLLVNHTSVIDQTHLLDSLLSLGIAVTKIFAPEHGFRGNVANGETVLDGKDLKTGIDIVSLYGKNKKPDVAHLSNVDVMIYDIQDVGVRFYTYISSLHYMMEVCATLRIPMIILDRPNPNGDYVDGPVLEQEYSSFVGIHPIPVVYGMTVGELATMIVGEKWLDSETKLDLIVITLKNWNHDTAYDLPIKPSPNLPNRQSIRLYPSLCLFEGTNISVGRGTDAPFQMFGFPDTSFGDFSFVPKSIEGVSKYPKHENKKCFGQDLRNVEARAIMDMSYVITCYQLSNNKSTFFNAFFKNLAGNNTLSKQIKDDMKAEEIKATWQGDLEEFKAKREGYLLYP